MVFLLYHYSMTEGGRPLKYPTYDFYWGRENPVHRFRPLGPIPSPSVYERPKTFFLSYNLRVERGPSVSSEDVKTFEAHGTGDGGVGHIEGGRKPPFLVSFLISSRDPRWDLTRVLFVHPSPELWIIRGHWNRNLGVKTFTDPLLQSHRLPTKIRSCLSSTHKESREDPGQQCFWVGSWKWRRFTTNSVNSSLREFHPRQRTGGEESRRTCFFF